MAWPDEDFPSFDELEAAHFPASMLDGNALLPKSVLARQLFSPLGDYIDVGIPVATFQMTFIRGGLVLAAAIHHTCSDGPGLNGFLDHWADNCRALASGSPFTPLDPANLDRSRLISKRIPDAAEMEILDKGLRALRHITKRPEVADDWTPPTLSPVMYHFSKSSCEKLLARLRLEGSDPDITNYDTIIALIWKSITKARIPYQQEQPGEPLSTTTLMPAWCFSNVLDPPLPPRYLGNSMCFPMTEPMAIEDVVVPDNLASLASRVRASTLSINAAFIEDSIAWSAGTEDKRTIGFSLNSFLGFDVAGASWMSMNYGNKDFGFGAPMALRYPSPQMDGCYILYPPRASSADPDEGIEVCVCLEQSCQERLLLDEEFGEFAQPREASQ